MAGHSKWANIKYRKGKADVIKGKLFSRLTKEIISAVKQGGADPKANTKLRMVLHKARSANLPNENIERNIKKATSAAQTDYIEISYELYGYAGVGIIVEIMTDNKNRSASEMRIATNKKGGSIANPGSVAFNFERKGIIQGKKNATEEELFNLVIESGAEDFDQEEGFCIITTASDQLFQVRESLENQGFICEEAQLQMVPKTYIECNSENQRLNLDLIEYLEAIDDVDAVYHNMKLS
ncbi:putative transcriptional regulatory protein [Candidatus Rhabdochlamydia oedothoracis]|uniref:Probable transcriptional regulatory protein RHABOEDO_000569 n=1 Tax=Candidatus Rhabdochlamydia oedothoracis TaxID=2720720 RepID=A0ABX8V5V1_9BACT|nr:MULTISPECIES: YebC/PmpR family DNA-binding transcriptional regulator [Rhabdochlamydia]KAG6559551.1 Transcriptional regulatory protein PmpR [Candidatus Rhabdochlamydia sp. W815]MCL6755807.1 YebC/PmpR family DNA-binding transcriptional regulator [Candidatus Rhabdochlamydia oedothoracis]QYF48413.1 putative transcriptional regulatory protein [Candidatus Rhabdochlamydia oedothoracis]